MGEAKRRRRAAAVGGETMMRDLATGDEFPARVAGSPTELLAQFRALAQRAAAGERPAATVPCNGCQACCRTQARVPLDPEADADLLPHLDVIADDEGLRLNKMPDGSCVHLGPAGCTPYEFRPAACRLYDCRVFGLAAMRSRPAANGACEPAWVFTPTTPEDFALLMLMQLGARQYLAAHPDDTSDGAILAAALAYAMPRLNKTAWVVAELRALPAAQRKALASTLLARAAA